MSPLDVILVLKRVASVFDRLGVPYYVGGSVASSAYGVARSTIDIDLVADLRAEHVAPFVEALQEDFYVDAPMIRDAIARKSCFNVIYLPMMAKIDVFAVKDRSFDRESFRRAREETLDLDDAAGRFPVASPEDIVLNKLEWFRLGDEVSERQWHDVLGVLKVQGEALDRKYLEHWALELGVPDLLEKAWRESAGPGGPP